MKNEIILFQSENKDITIPVSIDEKTIRKHINNVFNEELSIKSNTQKMRVANSDKLVSFYTLDVIISVGYRVKSKRGVEFRRWANKVLKQYIINRYAF